MKYYLKRSALFATMLFLMVAYALGAEQQPSKRPRAPGVTGLTLDGISSRDARRPDTPRPSVEMVVFPSQEILEKHLDAIGQEDSVVTRIKDTGLVEDLAGRSLERAEVYRLAHAAFEKLSEEGKLDVLLRQEIINALMQSVADTTGGKRSRRLSRVEQVRQMLCNEKVPPEETFADGQSSCYSQEEEKMAGDN